MKIPVLTFVLNFCLIYSLAQSNLLNKINDLPESASFKINSKNGVKQELINEFHGKDNWEYQEKKFSVTKRILIEEGTGTGCGWCPRGIVYMDSINHWFPGTTALVSVHVWNADPMNVSEYQTIVSKITTGYPGGFIDRQKPDIDPIEFKDAYLKRITYSPPVDVNISNVIWNSSTRKLSFTVNALAVVNMNGNYRFNAVVTEMRVHGTTNAYNQANAYSNGSNGKMGGFESLPHPVPSKDMYYDYTARALLGNWDGTPNSIPATVNSGTTIKYDYTLNIPPSWNESNLNIIGFVINSNTGEVENCSKTSLLTTEVEEKIETELLLYPNPCSDNVYIRNYKKNVVAYVINALGELIKVVKNSDTISLGELNPGIYWVKLVEEENHSTHKIILIK